MPSPSPNSNIAEVLLGCGQCINTGYINTNMILASSKGGGFNCLSININIHINLSATLLTVCPTFGFFLCLLLSCLFFFPQQTIFLPLSCYPCFLPFLYPSRVMEMSHTVLWFLAVWWPVLDVFLTDSHWSCLGAACFFSGLAGPAQPVSPHDDHWLTYSITCLVLSGQLTSSS